MQSKKTYQIFSRKTSDRSLYIQPQGRFSVDFELPAADVPVTHRIVFHGEPDYFWQWRCEPGAPYSLAMSIDDALIRSDTYEETYSLKMQFRAEDVFSRNAYLKIYRTNINWKKNFRPGQEYCFWIPVKGSDFHVLSGGEAGAFLEIYHEKPGHHPDDTFDLPDEMISLDFPQGTFDWTVLSKSVVLNEKTACLVVRVGGRNASGTILAGTPRLAENDDDSCIVTFERTQSRRPEMTWLGENLSRRDWLECRITIDGREIFNGEKYASIVRRPDFTFDAGTLAPGKHTLTLTLQNDYDNSVGFLPMALAVEEFGNHSFELIGAPKYIHDGMAVPVLLRINRPHTVIHCNGIDYVFDTTGLHGLKLPPVTADSETISLFADDHQDAFSVMSAGPLPEVPIYLSSSDAIYARHTIEDMDLFLEWYLSENIGNAICFRHAYRWGGGRDLNATLWIHVKNLLEELGMPYELMPDGREMPGVCESPTDTLLNGPLYIGRRAHENDGAFCYSNGGTDPIFNTMPGPCLDLFARKIALGSGIPHVRPVRNEHGIYRFFNPYQADNMEQAATLFVKNLHDSRGIAERHSGPSTLFRYFFQAGYKILYAEQMYGPEEIVLGSLRGASRAYGVSEYGVHLATQWSSWPLDSPEHAERYFLSLASSYIQGASFINLEEGLYRMEQAYGDFDKTSDCCRLHREAHQRFRSFMEMHPRNGKFVAPIACLQGRYDGWRCFGRGNVFGMAGDDWRFGAPEESFDLLKTFFPRNVLDAIYVSDCSAEPHGWYSGTPFGAVDLMPFEGNLSPYRAIVFLGWHTYRPGDGTKLLDYVENGGHLVLSRRHLSMSVSRQDYQLPDADPALELLLGVDWKTDDTQSPRYRRVGKGMVIYFSTDKWPSEIGKEYSAVMAQLGQQILDEERPRGWIESNEDVEYAAYDQKDGSRIFYLLNIRWWDRKPSRVILHAAGTFREIWVSYGQIITVNNSGVN